MKEQIYLIHAQSNKYDKLVKAFHEGCEKGKDTDDLVLSPGGRVEERRYKGWDTFYYHKSDNDDPDAEKNMMQFN